LRRADLEAFRHDAEINAGLMSHPVVVAMMSAASLPASSFIVAVVPEG